jgi:hypothetical protein
MTTRARLWVALATMLSTTATGSAFAGDNAGVSGSGPTTSQSGAPADPVAAAVAKLKSLGEEGPALLAMRSGIQDKLGQARNWLILVKSKEPGSDADEAKKSKWKAELAETEGLVGNIAALARKFDEETFPAFLTRFAQAKADVEKAKLAAEQAAATKEAKAKIDTSVAGIKKLQAANAQAAATLQARFRAQPKPK